EGAAHLDSADGGVIDLDNLRSADCALRRPVRSFRRHPGPCRRRLLDRLEGSAISDRAYFCLRYLRSHLSLCAECERTKTRRASAGIRFSPSLVVARCGGRRGSLVAGVTGVSALSSL